MLAPKIKLISVISQISLSLLYSAINSFFPNYGFADRVHNAPPFSYARENLYNISRNSKQKGRIYTRDELSVASIAPITIRRVATCKPGKPGLTSFSETLALFFIQILSFRKMKVQDRQNGPSGLPEKTGWLRAWLSYVLQFLEGIPAETN